MEATNIDTNPFVARHHKMPETDRMALWAFRVKEGDVNVWGRWMDAAATIGLYMKMNGIEGVDVSLVDYHPMPIRRAVKNIEY